MNFNHRTGGVVSRHTRTGDITIAADADPASFAPVFFGSLLSPPVGNFSGCLNRFFQTAAGNFKSVGGFLPGSQGVLKAHIKGIKPQFLCRDIKLHFCGKSRLRDPVPPHRTGRLGVGVNPIAFGPHIWEPVRHAKKGTHQIETQRPDAQISPAIGNDVRVKGQKRSVFFETCLEIDDGRMPLPVGKKHLLLTDHNPDRFARLAGKHGGAKVHIEHFVFAAEPAANIRLNHTDLAQRNV